MPVSPTVGSANVAFTATNDDYLRGAGSVLGMQNRVNSAMVTATNRAVKYETANAKLARTTTQVSTSIRSSIIATLGYAAGVSALTLAVSGTARAFGEWEDGMIAIAKTANLTEREIERLEYRFNRLLTEQSSVGPALSTSRADLQEIGEIAGTLGITGVANLADFTETVALLGLTTTLNAEEASNALGRLVNNTTATIRDVRKLGSAITALGNNFLGGEKAITSMAERIARSTSEFNLPAEYLLSLSAVFAAAGNEAEQTATVMQRGLRALVTAAGQYLSGDGDTLEAVANAAKISVDDLYNSIAGRDWETALNALIDAFANLDIIGNVENVSRSTLFRRLFGGEQAPVRIAQTFGVAAAQRDEIARASQIASAEFFEPLALGEEASRALGTELSKLSIALNDIDREMRALGAFMLPFLRVAAESWRSIGLAIVIAGTALAARGITRQLRNYRGALEANRRATAQAAKEAQSSDRNRRRELNLATQAQRTQTAQARQLYRQQLQEEQRLNQARERHRQQTTRRNVFPFQAGRRGALSDRELLAQQQAYNNAVQTRINHERQFIAVNQRVSDARVEANKTAEAVLKTTRAQTLANSFLARSANALRGAYYALGGIWGVIAIAIVAATYSLTVWRRAITEGNEALLETQNSINDTISAYDRFAEAGRSDRSRVGELIDNLSQDLVTAKDNALELERQIQSLNDELGNFDGFSLFEGSIYSNIRGGFLTERRENLEQELGKFNELTNELQNRLADSENLIQEQVEKTLEPAANLRIPLPTNEDLTRQFADFRRGIEEGFADIRRAEELRISAFHLDAERSQQASALDAAIVSTERFIATQQRQSQTLARNVELLREHRDELVRTRDESGADVGSDRYEELNKAIQTATNSLVQAEHDAAVFNRQLETGLVTAREELARLKEELDDLLDEDARPRFLLPLPDDTEVEDQTREFRLAQERERARYIRGNRYGIAIGELPEFAQEELRVLQARDEALLSYIDTLNDGLEARQRAVDQAQKYLKSLEEERDAIVDNGRYAKQEYIEITQAIEAQEDAVREAVHAFEEYDQRLGRFGRSIWVQIRLFIRAIRDGKPIGEVLEDIEKDLNNVRREMEHVIALTRRFQLPLPENLAVGRGYEDVFIGIAERFRDADRAENLRIATLHLTPELREEAEALDASVVAINNRIEALNREDKQLLENIYSQERLLAQLEEMRLEDGNIDSPIFRELSEQIAKVKVELRLANRQYVEFNRLRREHGRAAEEERTQLEDQLAFILSAPEEQQYFLPLPPSLEIQRRVDDYVAELQRGREKIERQNRLNARAFNFTEESRAELDAINQREEAHRDEIAAIEQIRLERRRAVEDSRLLLGTLEAEREGFRTVADYGGPEWVRLTGEIRSAEVALNEALHAQAEFNREAANELPRVQQLLREAIEEQTRLFQSGLSYELDAVIPFARSREIQRQIDDFIRQSNEATEDIRNQASLEVFTATLDDVSKEAVIRYEEILVGVERFIEGLERSRAAVAEDIESKRTYISLLETLAKSPFLSEAGRDEFRSLIDSENESLREANRLLEEYDNQLQRSGEIRAQTIAQYEDVLDIATQFADAQLANTLRTIRIQEVWVDGLRKVEDAFVQLVSTGQTSFKSLINSMIADLARLIFRASITQRLLAVLQAILPASAALNLSGGIRFISNPAAGFDPSNFAFHGGGVIGQNSGFRINDRERLILGEVGEEVLTRRNARHRYNLGNRLFFEGLERFHNGGIIGGQRGGGGGDTNIGIELINRSSQPIEARDGGERVDAGRLVKQVILEDYNENGVLAQQGQLIFGKRR